MSGPESAFEYARMNSDIGKVMDGAPYDFAALMRDVAAVLRATGARHAALGAFAAQALGAPGMRSTYDIDLVVHVEDIDSLVSASAQFNFEAVEIVPGEVWEFRHRLADGEYSSVEKMEVFTSGSRAVEDHPYVFEDPSGYCVVTDAGINSPDVAHALVHKAVMPRGKDITDSAAVLRFLPADQRIAALEEARIILRRHGGRPGDEAEKRLDAALAEAEAE